jgi:predicted acyl esterase
VKRLAGVVVATVIAMGLVPAPSSAKGPAACDKPKAAANCASPDAPWWEGWSLDDPRLSQPAYTDTVVEDLTIVASDGEPLAARVLRPAVPEGTTIPAVMQLSPYLRADIAPESILPELQKHDYVARGYALIGVSLRGSGSSGGCLDYQGERDRADVDAILDTIAAQPWSNGRVGAIGLSWDGASLNAAALSGNPHLATIVPNGSITDWYLWSYLGGAPGWPVGYTFNLYGPAVVQGAFGQGVPAEQAADRGCPDLVEQIVVQEQSAVTGVRTDWWDERDLVRFVDDIHPDLAVLQVHGGLDIGVRTDQLHAWDAALRQRLDNYRLLLGSWGHLWPDTPDIPAFDNPDLEFNRHPLTGWPVILLRWFDHFLKGSETGITQLPGALLQDQLGQWHAEDALQPTRAKSVRLYPGAQGTLTAAPGDGQVAFLDNGQGVDPRGSCVYVGVGWILGCAPIDPGAAQFFRTEPFDAETRFSGITTLRVKVSHSAPHGRVGASLYVIDGDHWKPVTFGMSSLNLRDGDEHTFQPITPGEVYTHEVELMARDIVVPPGHSLGLAIGSLVDMNPRGLSGNGYAPVPSGGMTEVYLGEDTVLELSGLPGPTPLLPLE